VRLDSPPRSGHTSPLAQIAQESGDSQDSLWRSTAASVRGYAQGHDGLQAHRPACAVSEFGEWAGSRPNALGAKYHAVCDAPNHHLSALLATISIVQDSHARPTARVRRPVLPLRPRIELRTESKRRTRASSRRSNPTRNCAGSHTSGQSISRYNCKTARSARMSRPWKPQSSSFSQSRV
jgi:hypothetical protein